MSKEQGPQILDGGKYQALHVHQVPAFELVLVDPDTLNEIGRDKGLPVQAGAITDTLANRIYLRWPPIDRHDPTFEYGMDKASIERALGYEVLSNLLHLDTDPLGR